jgi:hypothetical protein
MAWPSALLSTKVTVSRCSPRGNSQCMCTVQRPDLVTGSRPGAVDLSWIAAQAFRKRCQGTKCRGMASKANDDYAWCHRCLSCSRLSRLASLEAVLYEVRSCMKAQSTTGGMGGDESYCMGSGKRRLAFCTCFSSATARRRHAGAEGAVTPS